MGNVFLDLWMEQKSHPWRLAGKIAGIILALFIGVAVSGFAFNFVIVAICVFAFGRNRSAPREEIGGVRELPEMVYLVPRPPAGMKQHELQKNLVRAVFYAGITILGYGITIGTAADLSLDRGMLLLLVLLFVYQFLMFYHYYLYQVITVYQRKSCRNLCARLECFCVGVMLAGLCCYKFTGYAVMAFLENALWWVESVAAIVFVFVIQCIQIRRCMKRWIVSDYRR